MNIRKIVVPLTGADADKAALAAAFRIACAEGAHVDGVYLRPDPAEAVPYVGDAASASVIEDIYRATKAAADAASAAAKLALETAAAAAHAPLVETLAPATRPTARFADIMGSAGRVIVRKARLADLVVTAELATNPSALAAFEAVLMSARRPILVAPSQNPAQFGNNVIIAWNGSTEAAYAVSAALPFLKSAKSVLVLSAELDPLDAPPGAAVVAYLSLHGVQATAGTLDPAGKSVAAALIERAAAQGADLIVMGGYGHSRLREFILGGVTRQIITHATIAVLMAH